MSNIYVMGDIHGMATSFHSRVYFCIDDPQPDDAIIICGDAGLEYGNYISKSLKQEMQEFSRTIYIMRGNHDTRYWRDHPDWVQENNLLYQKKYDNIKYIKDEGGLYNIAGNNILFIPGAYSIDKDYRLSRGACYEWEEQLTWAEQDNIINICNNNNIDYIISHTCPLRLQKYFKDLFLSFIDQSTVDNSMEKFLDKIDFILQSDFKHWYFGHYHADRNMEQKYTMLYKEIVKLGESFEW